MAFIDDKDIRCKTRHQRQLKRIRQMFGCV